MAIALTKDNIGDGLVSLFDDAVNGGIQDDWQLRVILVGNL